MSTVTTDPAAEVELFRARVDKLQRALKELGKALKEIDLQDTRKLKQRLERLAKLELGSPDLQSELSALTHQLEGWRKEQERGRPLKFGRDLREAAEHEQLACSTLTQEPPSYWLDPFTLEVDFSKGKATLCYARQPLAETALDPRQILDARNRMLQALETEFDPQDFFRRLQTAYQRAGGKNGERVELVELLPELALLSQPPEFRKDPTRENFRPYGRVRLAYDLARLRKSGQLSQNGQRLTLGTATIGTTKQKDRVLFLEEGQGRGQYYLTAAFQ